MLGVLIYTKCNHAFGKLYLKFPRFQQRNKKSLSKIILLSLTSKISLNYNQL